MRLHFALKFAILYLLVTIGIFIWVMTTSGDTPILPALFLLLPWGLMFSEQFKDMPEFALLFLNIGLNTILLYITGKIFENLLQRIKGAFS